MIPLSFEGTPLFAVNPGYPSQSASAYGVETTIWQQNFTASSDPRPGTNDYFSVLGSAHIHSLDDMMSASFSASVVEGSPKVVVGGAWLIRAVSDFRQYNWMATIPYDGANICPALPDGWTGVSGTSVSSFPARAITNRTGDFMICASMWGDNEYGSGKPGIRIGGAFFLEGQTPSSAGIIGFNE